MTYGSADEIAKLRAEHELALTNYKQSLSDTARERDSLKAEVERLTEALDTIAHRKGWHEYVSRDDPLGRQFESGYNRAIAECVEAARAALAGQPAAAPSNQAEAAGYNPHFDATPEAEQVIADHLRDDDSAYSDAPEAHAQAKRILAALAHDGLAVCTQGLLDQVRSQPAAAPDNGQLLNRVTRAEASLQWIADRCRNHSDSLENLINDCEQHAKGTLDLNAAAEQAGPSPVDELLDNYERIRSTLEQEASPKAIMIRSTCESLLAKYGRPDKQGGDG